MRIAAIALLALGVVLSILLYGQTPSAAQAPAPAPAPATTAAAGTPSTADLTVEQRLSSLETKLDQLSAQVGKVSSRTSLSDFVERRFNDLEKKLDEILRDMGAVQTDLRRLK